MPENPWNEVNARSAALVARLQTILSGPAAGNAGHALEDAEKEIADLATSLRRFGQPLVCRDRQDSPKHRSTCWLNSTA